MRLRPLRFSDILDPPPRRTGRRAASREVLAQARQGARLFPNDAACLRYLEKIRWPHGFVCPHCATTGEPYRLKAKPLVRTCRACRRRTSVTAGTALHRSKLPPCVVVRGALLISTAQVRKTGLPAAGFSALQLQEALGLSRPQTAAELMKTFRKTMAPSNRGTLPVLRQTVLTSYAFSGVPLIGLAAVGQRAACAGTSNPEVVDMRLQIGAGNSAEAFALRRFVAPGTSLTAWNVDNARALNSRARPVKVARRPPIGSGAVEDAGEWLRLTYRRVGDAYVEQYLSEYVFRFARRCDPNQAFADLLGLAVRPRSARSA